MSENPKQHLLRQIVTDQERILDLSVQRASGDLSLSLKQEIDVLEQTIQVKTALVAGMKDH